jgi:hypothetical protein
VRGGEKRGRQNERIGRREGESEKRGRDSEERRKGRHRGMRSEGR